MKRRRSSTQSSLVGGAFAFLVAAVLVAGVIGGPVAGLLTGGDGPVVAGSSSERADALVEQATGAGASPGVVALVTPAGGVASPGGRAAVAQVQRTLTTDYGVLLLSRIVDGHRRGLTDKEAVTRGLQRTGRLLTAAAILLAVAIGSFLTSDLQFLKQIGLGAAFAVLIDAFIVRGLLVPSLMALLGDWNWWSPAPLKRLHERIGIREDHGDGAPAGAAA